MHTNNIKKIFVFTLSIVFSVVLITEKVNAEIFIEDELINHPNFNKVETERKYQDILIKDELLEQKRQIRKDVFNLEVSKDGQYETSVITDELLSPGFVSKAAQSVIIPVEKVDDLFFEKQINPNRVRIIKPKIVYDFTKKQVPVQIQLVKNISSKGGMLEGDLISFVATHEFTIKNKNFKKGTEIIGRVETVSASDKMGTPFNIKIDNFYINEDPNIILHGSISKAGADRSIWVYPLYQAGNICFYVAGFVFVPIHGGHAKLSTEEKFTVFYETN